MGYPRDPLADATSSEPRSLLVPNERIGQAQNVEIGTAGAGISTRLIGGDGITVRAEGVHQSVNLDIAKLEPAENEPSLSQWIAVWQEGSGSDELRRIPTDVIGTDAPADSVLYGRINHSWSPVGEATSVAWTNVTGKPSTFPPSAHNHPWSDLVGVPASFPPSAHTHPTADVLGLDAALLTKEPAITAGNPAYYWAGDKTWKPISGLDIAAGDVRYVMKIGDTMTGELYLPNGNAGTPSLSFGSDQNTGLYRVGADSIGFTTNGTVRMTLDTVNASFGLVLLSPDGTNALPAYSFLTDTNTGMYRVTTDTLGFATGGSIRFQLQTTAATLTVPLFASSAGTAAAPAINFGTANTGLYGSAFVAVTIAGTATATFSSTTLTSTLPVTLPNASPTNADHAARKKYVDDLISTHTHTASQVTDFAESVDDRVAALLVQGTNITLTYNDVANTLTVAAAGGAGGTAATTSFTPAGGIAATNVQAALVEVDSEKISDAVSDGKLYGRKNAAWAQVSGSFGGMIQGYLLNLTVAAPPAAGGVRFNNATQSSVTQIWLHYLNEDGVDIKTYLSQRVKVGDNLYVQDRDDSTRWQLYEVNSALVDNTTYCTIPVTWKAGGTTLAAQRVVISRESAGGVGVPEAPTDGQKYERRGSDASWQVATSGGGGTAATTTFTPAGAIAATDVQAALVEVDSEKLAKAGGTMTGNILGATVANGGTNSTPSFAIDGDPDTGMYSGGANVLRFATAGTQRVSIGTSGIDFSLILREQDGAVGGPAFTFTSDATTGMYRSAASTIAFATAGVLRFSIDTLNVTTTLLFLSGTGAPATPAYAFSSDPNTGMYQTGTPDTLAFSAGGTGRLTIGTTYVAPSVAVTSLWGGTAAATAYNFNTAGTGLFGDATTVNVATGGTLRWTWSTTAVTSTLPIVLPADPTTSLQAATKQYVDGKFAGKITVAASAPGSPATNDLWVDTT